MLAATVRRYGPTDVLRIEERPRPTPQRGQVLVKVEAAAVTTADWRLRASAFPAHAWLPARLMFGLTRPRHLVPGTAFSGRVVELSETVNRFRLGDAVFGMVKHGAQAEYVAVDAEGPIAHKPEGVRHVEAAAVPFGGLTALYFLQELADLRPGQRVLINGASGGVGAYAVQIARQLGAEVTGVASARNHDLLRHLGAEHVIDYHSRPVPPAGARYDLVLDTVGALRFQDVRAALRPVGRFLPLEFGPREMVQALVSGFGKGPKVILGVSPETREGMEALADMMKRGQLGGVVNRVLPLDRISEAHEIVETRRATGVTIVRPGEVSSRELAA